MSLIPFPWKNKKESATTDLDRQNLNAAELNIGAYVDAVAAETRAHAASEVSGEAERAEAAEESKLSKGENLKDVASASAARGALGLGTAATHNEGDFDPAGAAATAAAAERVRAEAAELLRVLTSERGAALGVATLDSTGKVPSGQLPAAELAQTRTLPKESELEPLAKQLSESPKTTIAVVEETKKAYVWVGHYTGVIANDWAELPLAPVTSVNAKTGAVSLSFTDVGADKAGAATAAQEGAESTATAKVNVEKARAEAAESANKGLAEAAKAEVAAEESRAKAAEKTKLAKAENLKDVSNVATARTNLGLGTAATHAATDFDTAGAASSAQTAAELAANNKDTAEAATRAAADTAEETRAKGAEGERLKKSENLHDVESAEAARTNLGLGTSATHAATDFIATAQRGAAEGVAELDSGGKLPIGELPAPNAGGHYETSFGDAVHSSFTLTHNLKTLTPAVTVVEQSTSEVVQVDIKVLDENRIELSSTTWNLTPPGVSSFRASVDASSGLVATNGTVLTSYVQKSEKGLANGVASLDEAALLPGTQLPTPLATLVAPPTGVTATDSANAEAAFNASVNGTVRFREGTYSIDNVVVGSTASLGGKRLRILGAGDGATRIKPGGTGRIFTFQGPTDSTSQYLSISDLSIGQSSSESTDYLYDAPLIQLVGITGYSLRNFSARINGTGTLIKQDNSWQGECTNATLRAGRFGVALEVDDSVGSPKQLDTCRYRGIVHIGNYGLIHRNIANSMDSLVLDQFKTVLEPTTDRDKLGEGELNKEAKAGEASIELKAGQAAAMGYEAAAMPMPVLIGTGEVAEVAKVTAVAGDVLTVSHPLRFAHKAEAGTAGQVLYSGCSASFPSNLQAVTISACHTEGPGIGFMAEGPVAVKLEGGKSTARRLLRLCGAAQDVILGPYALSGSTPAAENYVIDVPEYNAAALARLRIEGPLAKTGSVNIELFHDPGNRLASVATEVVENVGGIPQRTKNVASASGTAIAERSTVQGSATWTRSYAGRTTISMPSGTKAIILQSTTAGSAESPEIEFLDSQEPTPKRMAIRKVSNTRLAVKDNSGTSQIIFDTGSISVIIGEGADFGLRRTAAKIGTITDGGTTNLGTLGFKLIDINVGVKNSAEITAALPAGVTASADLIICDTTGKQILFYNGTKWMKSTAFSEIA